LYIGQTKRYIGQCFKEHLAHVSKDEGEKSSVVKYLVKNPNHVMTSENIPLVSRVDDPWKLDVHETIAIKQNDDKQLLNEDLVNVQSVLVDLFSCTYATPAPFFNP
jgi:hypothetical protein